MPAPNVKAVTGLYSMDASNYSILSVRVQVANAGMHRLVPSYPAIRRTAGGPYCAVLPPLTAITWPVRNSALFDARNTMVWAISSGLPERFAGTPATGPPSDLPFP